MMCLGLEPEAAGWKAQTNPLNCGGTPNKGFCDKPNSHKLINIFLQYFGSTEEDSLFQGFSN